MDRPGDDAAIERAAASERTLPTTTNRSYDDVRRQGISRLAHHLRTPLALVLGPLELLEASADLTERDRRQVAVAAKNVERLRGDIERLAEIASWPHRPDPKDVDVAASLRRVVSARQADAAQRHVTIEFAAGSVEIPGDPHVMSWALDVIIAEVVERTRDARLLVTVDDLTFDDGVAVTVTVERGDDADRIRDLTTDLAGSAAGRIALDVLELYGGRLAADGTAGRARTLRIEWPAALGPHAAEQLWNDRSTLAASAGADAAWEGGVAQPVGPADRSLVLVVEDDDDLRGFLDRMLSTDYRVITVATAEEGLAAAQQLRPDLIICDIVLPHGSGEQLVHALDQDENLSDIGVIIVTGRTDEQLRVRLLRDGADDYVVKPFVVDELKARIANLEASRLDIEELRTKTTEARTLADQLQQALDSRVIIEQAKGLLAEHLGADVSSAFEVLRRHARNNSLKLHDVARDVVERGLRP